MRKILLFVAVAVAAIGLKADYLYFQIMAANANNNLYYSNGSYYFNGKQVTGANVMMSTDGGVSYQSVGFHYGADADGEYIEPGTSSEPSLLVSWGDGSDFTTSDVFDPEGQQVNMSVSLEDVGDTSAYSFYIELVGYDTAAFGAGKQGVVGVGDVFSYATLSSSNMIVPTGDVLGFSVWTGGTYNVPEPSGALLLLVGAALMGLKRRKV